jgi:hypothetical protein
MKATETTGEVSSHPGERGFAAQKGNEIPRCPSNTDRGLEKDRANLWSRS